MRFSLASAVALLTFAIAGSDAVTYQIVRINAKTGLVCLILPPSGKIIGDTQTIGKSHCTDGKPNLLPQNFFVTKNFLTTKTYVQAWGFMDDSAVGMLKSDGGGQYDIHVDSGYNKAEGYPVFVELLEPDTGRWCIRFCHALGTDCNMGKSSAGCEGALGITNWPTKDVTSSSSSSTSNSTSSSAAGSNSGGSSSSSNSTTTHVVATSTANSTVANTASTSGTAATSTSSTGSQAGSKSTNGASSVVAPLKSILPLAGLTTVLYALFL